MLNLLRNLWKDEQGQDIAEYALMLAVVLAIAIAGATLLGTNASARLQEAANSIGV